MNETKSIARHLSSKVAIVTGGASGIGGACVDALASAGARVVIVDLNGPGAEAKARQIPDAAWHAVDVTDTNAFAAVVERTLDRFGRLDYAVNNAGGGGAIAATAEFPVETWRTSIDTYLSSVFYCMRAEVPAMLQSGGGAIVNVASVMSLVARAQSPAYVAAKHGVLGLTRVAALDYARQNIRVNTVAPGFIRTPILDLMDPADVEALAQQHPVGRIGEAAEVAALVEFLLSDKASFCTGGCYTVDGGYTVV